MERDTTLARLLVERGAEVDLRLAAGLGMLDNVKGFLDKGVPSQAANRLYRANLDTILTHHQVIDEALNFAAYGGHEETVDFLLTA